jgi:hypothetical protein
MYATRVSQEQGNGRNRDVFGLMRDIAKKPGDDGSLVWKSGLDTGMAGWADFAVGAAGLVFCEFLDELIQVLDEPLEPVK